jgi:CSLREA domain-containing protein
LAHAAAINVTTTADECDITGTACSPREAIQAANTDDSPLLVCESGYDGTWARRAGASLNRLARRVVCGGSFYSRLDYRFRVAVSLARPQS